MLCTGYSRCPAQHGITLQEVTNDRPHQPYCPLHVRVINCTRLVANDSDLAVIEVTIQAMHEGMESNAALMSVQ